MFKTCLPSLSEFLKLSRRGNLIPVYREISADLETPVSAYWKLSRGQGARYSFLLESVEGEEKIARFSFLAKNPELVLQSKGRSLTLTRFTDNRSSKVVQRIADSPLTAVRDHMKRYKFVEVENLPRFCGGLVGYIGYDVVRFFERLPQKTKDDLNLPDMIFVLAKDLVIFDHRHHTIKIVSCVEIPFQSSRGKKIALYRQAIGKIERTLTDLSRPLVPHRPSTREKAFTPALTSNFTRRRFEKIVRLAKQYIRDGDIIQVVLSQRFSASVRTNPFNIYRALRTLNPSPYMYYLDFHGLQIAGSSPELLVRCENGIVETRPIAGTRRRGNNEKEDAVLAKELLNDPKETAEHIMLVDLGRNDLGRVCRQGTVKVSEFMLLERYSHVMHIVSNVKGQLRPGKDSLDVLQATFPAGTVSGAPKIRAMEIIEDLEGLQRGPYAGCIGYISFSGNLDTCITIRTIVILKNKVYVQAGAGIVADSIPKREFLETVNKAKAQFLAIQQAHCL